MSITLELPEEITAEVLRGAELAGQTPEWYVAEAIERQFAPRQLQERQQAADIEWVRAMRRQAVDPVTVTDTGPALHLHEAGAVDLRACLEAEGFLHALATRSSLWLVRRCEQRPGQRSWSFSLADARRRRRAHPSGPPAGAFLKRSKKSAEIVDRRGGLLQITRPLSTRPPLPR